MRTQCFLSRYFGTNTLKLFIFKVKNSNTWWVLNKSQCFHGNPVRFIFFLSKKSLFQVCIWCHDGTEMACCLETWFLCLSEHSCARARLRELLKLKAGRAGWRTITGATGLCRTSASLECKCPLNTRASRVFFFSLLVFWHFYNSPQLSGLLLMSSFPENTPYSPDSQWC